MVYGSELQQNDSTKGPETSMGDGEKKERVWEHPWTTDEIRKNSGKWTLAGDVGLLNHLHDFSQKLISRTHEMEKVVDSLVHQSKVAGSKVNNVINDFQMLSNVQFVENRVYDEEAQEPEPAAPKEVQPKTKEQREAEMLPRVIQALELGASVLDKAFERIEVDETSESEDDDDEDDVISRGRTILEPKDLYEHRPLPYVIGTTEFHNDDYAGLQSTLDDEPSVETTQEENMYSSTSSSESSATESEEDEFEEPLPSKQPLPAQRRNTNMSVDTMNTKFSDSESSDLFGEEREEEVNGYVSSSPADKKPDVNGVGGPRNPLMEELMQKAKPVPSPSSEKPETIQSSAVNKGSVESDDLFSSGDGLFQDEDSPFRKKTGLFTSNGIFSSGKDDKSEDEGDLFGDSVDKTESFQKKPAPISKVQVLPSPASRVKNSYEESEDLFAEDKSEPLERKPAPIAKVQVLPSPVLRMPSDDDDDNNEDDSDDDDLFGKTQQKAKSLEKKPAPVSKVQVLPTKEVVTRAKEKTAGPKVVKQPDLFGDDDDEESDLFSSLSTPKSTSAQKVPPVSDVQSSRIPDKSTPSPSVSERSSKSVFDSAKAPSGSASLFGDESDSEDLFTTSKKTTDQKGFNFNFSADANVDDDEFDLFGTKSTSKQTKSATETSNDDKKPSKKPTISLFEESDSFDLFGHAESKPKSEDSVAKKTESKAPLPSPAQSQKKPSTTLFEESDSFDLFSPVDKKEPQKPKTENLKGAEKAQEVSKNLHSSSMHREEDSKKTTEPVKVTAQPQEKKTPAPEIGRKAVDENLSKVVPTSSNAVGDVVDIAASFDKPLDVGNTLSAINKSRAKIQVKRKKPTRKGRQARMSSDSDFATDNETPTAVSSVKPAANSDLLPGPEEAARTETAVASPARPAGTHKQKEMDKRNLMSQLISEAKSSKLLKQNASLKVEDNVDNDDNESDDLFSSKVFGSKSKAADSDFSVLSPTPKEPDKVLVKDSNEIKGPKPEASSLLLSDSTSDEDLFSASAFKDFRNSLSKNSIFEDDDDDIFKSSENKDNLSRHSSEVLGEGNDDIFAGVEKEKYEMFPTQVFDDDDDDDDIFSNVITTSSKKEAPKEKPEPSKKSQDDLFDDPLGVA